ncbi:hypothetical protein SDC9_116740 [bioreactor metagenome]|uniref:Uncharacterized protein n=1 Tax=bioreactor metagenome TaxID=1076179 RepID=A0A645BWX2_9ZZZZ
MGIGSAPDSYISENATQSPHILIFEVTSRTIPVNFNSHNILTWLNVSGNIKFSSIAAIYTITDFLPVYPKEKTGIHAIESYKYTTSVPYLRQIKLFSVTPDGITF